MSDAKMTPKAILMPTLVLFSIALVVTLALSATNLFTKNRISAINKANLDASMQEILPADNYEGLYLDSDDPSKDPSVYKALDSGGELLGMVFVTAAKGYGGDVSVMTGVQNGEITKIKVVDCANETPGLGQNAQKPGFTDQFTGMNKAPELVKGGAAENQVDAMTGATITSRAVVTAVNDAIEKYERILAMD